MQKVGLAKSWGYWSKSAKWLWICQLPHVNDDGRQVINDEGWALRCDAEFGRDCSLRGILASGDVDLAIVLALVLRYDTICYWRYRTQLVNSFWWGMICYMVSILQSNASSPWWHGTACRSPFTALAPQSTFRFFRKDWTLKNGPFYTRFSSFLSCRYYEKSTAVLKPTPASRMNAKNWFCKNLCTE